MNYLLEKVTAFQPLEGLRARIAFADGFSGELDFMPLLSRGPIFAPLRDTEFFRRVVVSRHGVPEWSDDLDLSPGTLRVWCEAGRVLGQEETDAWVETHSGAAAKV